MGPQYKGPAGQESKSNLKDGELITKILLYLRTARHPFHRPTFTFFYSLPHNFPHSSGPALYRGLIYSLSLFAIVFGATLFLYKPAAQP